MTYLADTLIVIFLCACCIACVYFSSDLAADAGPSFVIDGGRE